MEKDGTPAAVAGEPVVAAVKKQSVGLHRQVDSKMARGVAPDSWQATLPSAVEEDSSARLSL